MAGVVWLGPVVLVQSWYGVADLGWRGRSRLDSVCYGTARREVAGKAWRVRVRFVPVWYGVVG